MPYTGPPRAMLRLFRWYCHPRLADHIEGDLIEVHREWISKHGQGMANFRLAVELILLFRPGIIRPWQSPQFINTYSMYKSFIIVAWRNFQKSKGYSSINIFGLAIALTACMLIVLYVRHELSFDRFNEKADRIYRVNNEIKFGDNHIDVAAAGASFASTAKAEFPQIEAVTRIRWAGSLLVNVGDERVRQQNVGFADSTLFDVFTLSIVAGNAKTALNEPNTIVLTESIARKFFGTTDVLGKTLNIDDNKTRKVTAVIKDIPSNSHFRFECFIPLVDDDRANEDLWAGAQNYATYLLLRPDADPYALAVELNKMMDRHVGPELKMIINKTIEEFRGQGDFFLASLTALPDIHLHSNRLGELYGTGKIEYVYMFSAIAVFILIIAVINFMNLATARSAKRAREVGVRKVLGSVKSSLIQQFILESVLTCALAMIIALALTAIMLPQFNILTGKSFEVDVLYSPSMIASFAALVLVVGLLSGSYPAFYLSAFQPVAVLKGGSGSVRRSMMRNTLVVFQFVASVTLIAGTIVIYRQMDYIRKRDLGFDREQILIINNGRQVGNRIEPLKNSLLSVTGVRNVTVSGFLPVSYQRSNNTLFQSPTLDITGAMSVQEWRVDDQYLKTMGMHIAEGRDFSKEIASDSSAVILNESAARFLGGSGMIGKKLYTPNDATGKSVRELTVVGIVKDFNFSTLRQQVAPLTLVYGKDQSSIVLKLDAGDITALMSSVEAKWKSIVPELPFEYSFMDADYDRQYEGERQAGTLFTVFAALSIIISCMGLFGLATFMAEQRTKEIGIRKVLGASVYGITSLLSRDFLRLVVLAVAIATPLAWYLIAKWLEGFAYRIDVSWWVFPVAGFIALMIACATVSYQSIRAAIANPVNSLRTE
ncbi:ABC transporter permease [Chryseolinea sp. T2]|uniref:ABC transporter permease n=1 Tax=Chryseolinea sp. T2 TaxID=3129255 RepID=UPI0030770D7F